MRNSLYDLLQMKSKNSIFKSVVITNQKTSEGYPLVEVEPYDQTFLNAISTVTKYDNTLDRIMLKVYEYFNREPVWLAIYTDEYGHGEYLLCDYWMKTFKLIS